MLAVAADMEYAESDLAVSCSHVLASVDKHER